VENVSLPPEVEQAIDKRSSMAAIGNLNDYVKLQMAEGMGKGTGGGPGGFAAEMAVGMGLAQQMLNQPGGILNPGGGAGGGAPATGQPPPAAGGATGGLPELLSPAQAAQALGVSEEDVMASLSSGDLKGKKIGATWRITREALQQFLKG
jgi:excisionase family DNA binding protein